MSTSAIFAGVVLGGCGLGGGGPLGLGASLSSRCTLDGTLSPSSSSSFSLVSPLESDLFTIFLSERMKLFLLARRLELDDSWLCSAVSPCCCCLEASKTTFACVLAPFADSVLCIALGPLG